MEGLWISPHPKTRPVRPRTPSTLWFDDECHLRRCKHLQYVVQVHICVFVSVADNCKVVSNLYYCQPLLSKCRLIFQFGLRVFPVAQNSAGLFLRSLPFSASRHPQPRFTGVGRTAYMRSKRADKLPKGLPLIARRRSYRNVMALPSSSAETRFVTIESCSLICTLPFTSAWSRVVGAWI